MKNLREKIYLKKNILVDRIEIILFKQINKFVVKYNNLPTKDTILIELNNRKEYYRGRI